ncbi:hypothetical protein BC829DRAFT_378911, partial [Chytridium lagenaria]
RYIGKHHPHPRIPSHRLPLPSSLNFPTISTLNWHPYSIASYHPSTKDAGVVVDLWRLDLSKWMWRFRRAGGEEKKGVDLQGTV